MILKKANQLSSVQNKPNERRQSQDDSANRVVIPGEHGE